MRIYREDFLRRLVTQVFTACETTPEDAQTLADHLVRANLKGLDSHGVLRVPQYVGNIKEKEIVPGADIITVKETATTALLDLNWNFGQIGARTATEMAIDKAILIAKASLADQLEGEMNKRSELYITEIGQEGNKEVASKVESTIVNIIEQTKVQGYEEWNKAVYETPDGQYRVYIGLKMGVGDANRLAAYIVANANNDVDIDALAEAAIDELEAVPTENVTETELN